MVLIDTSVLIDFFKGRDGDKTRAFEEVLKRDVPYGISAYTYQELLQGARDGNEFDTLKNYLSTLKIYFLAQEIVTHEKAAKLYFDLRRCGITVRSSIDILIALTAIENNLMLLHNDRDFDAIAGHVKALKIFGQFTNWEEKVIPIKQ